MTRASIDSGMPDFSSPESTRWVPSAEHCPVSVGARLIGDRWSLLIVRELLFGDAGFNELDRALPGLSKSTLATRLRYLQRLGVIESTATAPESRGRLVSYGLTVAGEALRPVLEALGDWALNCRLPADVDDRTNVALLLWRMQQSIDRTALPARYVTVQFLFEDSASQRGWVRVGPVKSSSCTGAIDGDPDLTVRTTVEIMSDLWWQRRRCEPTIASGLIQFDGPTDYAKSFRNWFGKRTEIQRVIEQ